MTTPTQQDYQALIDALVPLMKVADVLSDKLPDSLGLWSQTSSEEGGDIRLTVGDVRKIRAASPSEWQPIEDFPYQQYDNGTEILLCNYKLGWVKAGYYNNFDEEDSFYQMGAGFWGENEKDGILNPSHWRNLPPPNNHNQGDQK